MRLPVAPTRTRAGYAPLWRPYLFIEQRQPFRDQEFVPLSSCDDKVCINHMT
jgi:hypothetical protein